MLRPWCSHASIWCHIRMCRTPELLCQHAPAAPIPICCVVCAWCRRSHVLRRQRPDQDPALEAFARLNDGVVIHPPKKKATTPRYDWVVVWMWAFYQIFAKFWLLYTYLHLAGDSIGRVSRVSLPAGGAHQACRSLGQSLGRNPIGEPNLIPPFVTSCRAEQRGEILGGHSKDTEVREAQVLWDVVCVTVYRAWLLYAVGLGIVGAPLGWVV